MLALSVKQPYAEAIARGVKREEYRSWKTNHRGDLLIVASRAVDVDPIAHRLPRGIAIAVVRVVDVVEKRGGYAWSLEEPRRVVPIELRGSAALFHVDDERIVRAVGSNVVERIELPSWVARAPRNAGATTRARRSRDADRDVTKRGAGRCVLYAGGVEIARCGNPVAARKLATSEARKRNAYVSVHRDGIELFEMAPSVIVDAEALARLDALVTR